MTKARDLANLGNKTSLDEINDAYDAGALSNRNMVTNGSMQVAQRSTSVTGIGATGTAYHTIDRWQIETGNSGGRFTMSQSSDAPSGFGSSLKLDCTTAVTSIGTGEYLLLEYHLEGQDVQRIKTGTSDAEEVTISFYVKANAAFNFVLEVRDNTNARNCSKLFSTTTGWNRVELTYPADTIGEIVNSNASGIRLFFWIHAGSEYTGGTLNSSSFTTNALAANRASGISSFYSSTSNEFYLTGFQMEVGDTATPFEHRSYGEELAKCQRYYSVIKPIQAHPIWIYTSTNWSTTFPHPTTMRVVPSISFTGTPANTAGGSVGTNTFAAYSDGAWRGLATLTPSQSASSVDISRIDGTTNSAVTPGFSGGFYMGSNCFINMDAEL